MIDWSRPCAAVIPCFNEAGRIGPVVASVLPFLVRVIVVDDGSTDGTREEAEAAGAEVLRLPFNQGKGCALRAGWRHAHQAGYVWAMCLDGDGQHTAQDIPAFFAGQKRDSARLIIGNRMGKRRNNPAAAGKNDMPLVRRWTNHVMSFCLSAMTGEAVPDSQCGFRLIHLETALNLPLRSNRFEIESETLVSFLAAGEKVAFVPIATIYQSNRSNICPWRDTWRWVRWWAGQPPLTN